MRETLIFLGNVVMAISRVLSWYKCAYLFTTVVPDEGRLATVMKRMSSALSRANRDMP